MTDVPDSEFLEQLRAHAADINSCSVPDLNASPFYDMISDGLVWRDEGPSEVEAVWALRPLWKHRTDLIVGVARPRFARVWQEGLQICPRWSGFHPSRCAPTKELKALAELRRRTAAGEIEREFNRPGAP